MRGTSIAAASSAAAIAASSAAAGPRQARTFDQHEPAELAALGAAAPASLVDGSAATSGSSAASAQDRGIGTDGNATSLYLQQPLLLRTHHLPFDHNTIMTTELLCTTIPRSEVTPASDASPRIFISADDELFTPSSERERPDIDPAQQPYHGLPSLADMTTSATTSADGRAIPSLLRPLRPPRARFKFW